MPSDIGGLGSNDTLWAIAPDPIDRSLHSSVDLYPGAAVDPIESGLPCRGALSTRAALDPIRPAYRDATSATVLPGEPSLPSANREVSPMMALRSAGPIDAGLNATADRPAPACVDKMPDDREAPALQVNHVVGLPIESGHLRDDLLRTVAALDPLRPAMTMLTSFEKLPGGPLDAGQITSAARSAGARVDPALIASLKERWKTRQSWHKAEKSLTLQGRAVCRRVISLDHPEYTKEQNIKAADKLFRAALGKGDHPRAAYVAPLIAPLMSAREVIEAQRALIEKQIVGFATHTPVAAFVKATHGVGMLSLAGVIGEAGDLGLYANPAKLWKRMGLAVMPDGQRQRRVGGVEAMDHGYSPKRRSLVWTIGDCFVKAGGPYREVYDARKVYEAARVDEEGKPFRPIVIHLRAKRYAEKRLLRDLWRHWRKESA